MEPQLPEFARLEAAGAAGSGRAADGRPAGISSQQIRKRGRQRDSSSQAALSFALCPLSLCSALSLRAGDSYSAPRLSRSCGMSRAASSRRPGPSSAWLPKRGAGTERRGWAASWCFVQCRKPIQRLDPPGLENAPIPNQHLGR